MLGSEIQLFFQLIRCYFVVSYLVCLVPACTCLHIVFCCFGIFTCRDPLGFVFRVFSDNDRTPEISSCLVLVCGVSLGSPLNPSRSQKFPGGLRRVCFRGSLFLWSGGGVFFHCGKVEGFPVGPSTILGFQRVCFRHRLWSGCQVAGGSPMNLGGSWLNPTGSAFRVWCGCVVWFPGECEVFSSGSWVNRSGSSPRSVQATSSERSRLCSCFFCLVVVWLLQRVQSGSCLEHSGCCPHPGGFAFDCVVVVLVAVRGASQHLWVFCVEGKFVLCTSKAGSFPGVSKAKLPYNCDSAAGPCLTGLGRLSQYCDGRGHLRVLKVQQTKSINN